LDILTHTLSGIAVGTCLAIYARGGWKEKTGILFFSGLGGAMPDIDAISLWSKFDGTVGSWLNLSQPGNKIYSGAHWYSHHGFMHSLVAAVGFTVIIGFIFYLFSRKRIPFIQSLQKVKLILSGFILGYLIHLLQDMITPGGPWKGIRFFFPGKGYVGGTGDIWWWNNYDIFLIVLAVLCINMLLLFLSSFIKKHLSKISLCVLALGFIIATIQIRTRDFNFNEKPYIICEEKSKNLQKIILGTKLYERMERFDNSMRLPF